MERGHLNRLFKWFTMFLHKHFNWMWPKLIWIDNTEIFNLMQSFAEVLIGLIFFYCLIRSKIEALFIVFGRVLLTAFFFSLKNFMSKELSWKEMIMVIDKHQLKIVFHKLVLIGLILVTDQ